MNTPNVHFVRVMYVLFEPDLKLRAGAAWGNLDASGWIFLKIGYDPEIRADHLTMPVPEAEKASWRRVNTRPPPEQQPFRSPLYRPITELNVRVLLEQDTINLRVEYSADRLLLTIRALERLCPHVDGMGAEILCSALLSSMDLDAWDREDVTVRNLDGTIKSAAPRRKLNLFLSRTVAEIFAPYIEAELDYSNGEYVHVFTREIRHRT